MCWGLQAVKTMAYEKIDALQLGVRPLQGRRSYIEIAREALDPHAVPPNAANEAVAEKIVRLAERMGAARGRGAAVMMAYGTGAPPAWVT